MYATFSNDSTSASIHLMDVWMDSDDQAAVLEWLKFTFLTHYEGNRQPFGIYSHPIHYATSVPGVTDPTNIVATINTFLDWAQQHQDVWMVTNSQLIEWCVASSRIRSSVTNGRVISIGSRIPYPSHRLRTLRICTARLQL